MTEANANYAAALARLEVLCELTREVVQASIRLPPDALRFAHTRCTNESGLCCLACGFAAAVRIMPDFNPP